MINFWTEQSIIFAGQRNYLDELFRVYPVNPNLRRELSQSHEEELMSAYDARNVIGVPILNDPQEFLRMNNNCILNSSDALMQEFLQKYLGFTRNKGVDSESNHVRSCTP